jgi:predicted dehydrogenase
VSQSIVVAVVGAGGWGRNLVRNFAALPGAELRYVCDRAPAAREAAAHLAPSARRVDDFRVVLDDAEVAAVICATDAPSHASIARASLDAGKDVFVEKPLALRVDEAAELVARAESSGRILAVGHLLLFHPAVERLRALLAAGELGEVLYVTAQRLNLGVVRRDENAWWSLAPHDISLASHLLGATPVAVNVTGHAFLQRDRGVEDVVFATLHYPGGRLAHVHVSWLDPHKTRRLTLVGTKKMAVFDDGSADRKLTLYDKGVEPPATLSWAEGIRVRTGDIVVPAIPNEEPLRRECLAFLEAVRTRRAPLNDGRGGLDVVRVLEAGSRSLRERGRLVEVAS